MKVLKKTRFASNLSTYAELMKVCGCGTCFIGYRCSCGGTDMYYRLYAFPEYIDSEAEYRIDYGNHT
ncbi:MAG: hypothetical protein J6Z02_10195 [Lachnospiraceae bacterium]|nr:hypothetical protein [Lachnospiraceae bacterium]